MNEEISYAEKIAEVGLQRNWEPLKVMKDCFAIIRIERTISSLSRIAAFNDGPRQAMIKEYDKIEK